MFWEPHLEPHRRNKQSNALWWGDGKPNISDESKTMRQKPNKFTALNVAYIFESTIQINTRKRRFACPQMRTDYCALNKGWLGASKPPPPMGSMLNQRARIGAASTVWIIMSRSWFCLRPWHIFRVCWGCELRRVGYYYELPGWIDGGKAIYHCLRRSVNWDFAEYETRIKSIV